MNIHPGMIENLLVPVVAAQIFLTVLIYFIIVRKQFVVEYRRYVCFLSVFILFLLSRPIQVLWDSPLRGEVVYVRMALLFSVGLPTLLMAIARQSGMRPGKMQEVGLYGAGLLASALYILFLGAHRGDFETVDNLVQSAGFPPAVILARWSQIIGTFILLVLPCSGLMIKEIRGHRNPSLVAFLVGSWLFGVLLMIGMFGATNTTIYYVGSIVSALCWAWAVFRHIRDMKGEVPRLKDELQQLVRSGKKSTASEINKLLGDLEELSQGNLAVYKLRVRDILNRLTDMMIEAGGDWSALLERNEERLRAVDDSEDAASVREVACSEAVELSGLMAEIPEQNKNETIEQAETFIQEHFDQDIGVPEIAEAIGLSRSHLMREFKKATGKTVNQYLTHTRVERAKILLKDQSVTDTAFAVGFNDSSYFGTVFKRQVGMAPSQFKQDFES